MFYEEKVFKNNIKVSVIIVLLVFFQSKGYSGREKNILYSKCDSNENIEIGSVVTFSKGLANKGNSMDGATNTILVEKSKSNYDSKVFGIIISTSSVIVENEELLLRMKKEGAEIINLPKTNLKEIMYRMEKISELNKIYAKISREYIKKQYIVANYGIFNRCLVDASYGAINVGDLVTTSETPGHARVVLEGEIPPPGTILGKALGSLKKGKGTIPVLIMLR